MMHGYVANPTPNHFLKVYDELYYSHLYTPTRTNMFALYMRCVMTVTTRWKQEELSRRGAAAAIATAIATDTSSDDRAHKKMVDSRPRNLASSTLRISLPTTITYLTSPDVEHLAHVSPELHAQLRVTVQYYRDRQHLPQLWKRFWTRMRRTANPFMYPTQRWFSLADTGRNPRALRNLIDTLQPAADDESKLPRWWDALPDTWHDLLVGADERCRNCSSYCDHLRRQPCVLRVN